MSLARRKIEPRDESTSAAPPLTALPRESEDGTARLRDENRRLAVTLGGFSSFLASRGLLEEAWDYVNRLHALED